MARRNKRSSKPKATAREAALKVASELHTAGFTAYFAGGCVRDRLLGHEPEEYDIATDARPEQVEKIFNKVQKVGESFGVMLVRLKGHTVEVATFRTEGVYSDGRHPDEVAFTDAEHDAQRRDFTINGLFENPQDGEVIDHVGGAADLERGVIRAIGDPHARLREDRLRMLRAVRFAARFEFEIDAPTAEAIRTGAGALEGVSRERIGQEIKRMLKDPHRTRAAGLVQTLGLDAVVLEEEHRECDLPRLDALPKKIAYATALAAWILDRHPDEPEYWPRLADRWCGALMLSNAEHQALKAGLEAYRTLMNEWERLGVAAQKRLAASKHYKAGQALVKASDRPRWKQIRSRVASLAETGLAPEPLIDGNALIAAGMAPGPIFGRLLEAVYDAQLEGTVGTRDEALRMARALHWTLQADAGRPPKSP